MSMPTSRLDSLRRTSVGVEFVRQERQAPVRNCVYRERVEYLRILLCRLVWMPWLRMLHEFVRDETTTSAWRDLVWIAERLYAGRRA